MALQRERVRSFLVLVEENMEISPTWVYTRLGSQEIEGSRDLWVTAMVSSWPMKDEILVASDQRMF
jgi:hypothetical protein